MSRDPARWLQAISGYRQIRYLVAYPKEKTYFIFVSDVLTALVKHDGAVVADTFRRVRAFADERSDDTRPVLEHVTTALLRLFVTRPPAGWQAS